MKEEIIIETLIEYAKEHPDYNAEMPWREQE